VTLTKALKTVVAANAKPPASLLAKPLAVLQTKSVKTQRQANNSKD